MLSARHKCMLYFCNILCRRCGLMLVQRHSCLDIAWHVRGCVLQEHGHHCNFHCCCLCIVVFILELLMHLKMLRACSIADLGTVMGLLSPIRPIILAVPPSMPGWTWSPQVDDSQRFWLDYAVDTLGTYKLYSCKLPVGVGGLVCCIYSYSDAWLSYIT